MTPTLPPVITDISQLDPNGSYTYADYLRWHFTETVELIRGKIMRKMASPALARQRISMNLSWRLGGIWPAKRASKSVGQLHEAVRGRNYDGSSRSSADGCLTQLPHTF